MRILIRPLLVSGMMGTEPAQVAPVILVNSEQPEREQAVAFWHELLHVAMGQPYTCDEASHAWIEERAQALADAFPDVWTAVRARRETVGVEPRTPPT